MELAPLGAMELTALAICNYTACAIVFVGELGKGPSTVADLHHFDSCPISLCDIKRQHSFCGGPAGGARAPRGAVECETNLASAPRGAVECETNLASAPCGAVERACAPFFPN